MPVNPGRQQAERKKQNIIRQPRLALLLALCLLLSAFCSVPAVFCKAQSLDQTPPRPLSPLALSPLLYVKIPGPPGVHVTCYQGTPAGHDFAAPVTVGLRPGYIYRIELTGLPQHRELALYPTLEVRGTLQLPPRLRAMDYPAPIVVTSDDIDHALAGAVVTKVILLEHPDRAMALATQPDQPLELGVRGGIDPLDEARSYGRPLLVIRLGSRQLTREELARQSIPGTVLLPGNKVLPPPKVHPFIPWAGLPIYDPILGMRHPEEECLRDGGSLRAGLDAQGRLHGLQPSDTAAAYSDNAGGRHVAISNRLCICVPRFVVFRGETAVGRFQTVIRSSQNETVESQAGLQNRASSLLVQKNQELQALQSRERANETMATQVASAIGRLRSLHVVATVEQPRGISGNVAKPRAEPPGRPLVLTKWADQEVAHVGDVVTFYLKYSNLGGQPITDVAVSDSLTARLEYVRGSAQSDRSAVFSMQANEAGSVILHWEIADPLLPGQTGLLRFHARIR